MTATTYMTTIKSLGAVAAMFSRSTEDDEGEAVMDDIVICRGDGRQAFIRCSSSPRKVDVDRFTVSARRVQAAFYPTPFPP